MQTRQAVFWARDTVFDLNQVANGSNGPKQHTVPAAWSPPLNQWFKCNSDGAFDANNNHGASGMVLRDDQGSFVAAKTIWYPHVLHALHLEALACRDGLELAHHVGVQKIILETDSKQLVDLLNECVRTRSEVTPVIAEIRELSKSF